MGKISFKSGNMLYPLPAVLVTTKDREGRDNILTVAWTGTVCTNPPMLYISVRPERYSYRALRETGEFVVNLTTEAMTFGTDFCGVRSGRDLDKFDRTGFHREKAFRVAPPLIGESPVNIECRVAQEIPLGSHHMFIAHVVHVTVDERYMDEKGTFRLEKAGPIVYSHGSYFSLDRALGSFGYSVRKKKTAGSKKRKRQTGSGKNPDRNY